MLSLREKLEYANKEVREKEEQMQREAIKTHNEHKEQIRNLESEC